MLLEIPLFFAPSFYKMDLSEIPVMICAFYLGPVSGVICEFIKVLLKLLLKGTTTNFVGDFANFAVGCSFVLPASILYHWHRSRKGAIAALLTGTAVMTVSAACSTPSTLFRSLPSSLECRLTPSSPWARR